MPDNSGNNSKLNNIDPRKVAILLELAKEAEGKPMDKLLPMLMNANKRLQEQNLTFTKDESDILMEMLSKNLSPKEKMQFEMFKNMMSSTRKNG